jgi:hypothetical protein
MILIPCETMEMYHKQFGARPDYQHEIWLLPREKLTANLIERYLQWLSEQFNGVGICLILGQFKTHWCDGNVNPAEKHGIWIIWIPKVANKIYQSLDRHVFGELKVNSRAKWRKLFSENYGI